MERTVRRWIATLCAAAVMGVAASAQEPPSVRLVCDGEIPARAPGVEAAIGGISGLAYDGQQGTWIAVSDVPRGPCFVELKLTLGPALTMEIPARPTLHVEVVRVFGHPALERGSPTDAEAIAIAPDGMEWFVGFEQPPAVLRLNPATKDATTAPIEREFIEKIRANRAFESVALRPTETGPELWVATENALKPEPVATRAAGQKCRVLVLDPASLALRRESAYITEPLARGEDSAQAFVALADLAAMPDGRVLALEKDWSTEHGPGARIFCLSGQEYAIAGTHRSERALVKIPIADLRELGAAPMGTIEAMAIGPQMAKGMDESMLVLIEDNNFAPDRGSQVIVLGLRP